MKTTWKIFSDGGSRGNPGPGASGVVIYKNNDIVKRTGKFYNHCTNNFAEYMGVVIGLNAAKELGVRELDFYMDSQLVVRQMTGEYRVKNLDLRKIYLEIQELLSEFARVSFHHVMREKNKEADRVVNEIIDANLR